MANQRLIKNLLTGVIPLLVFISVLLIKIPYSITRFFAFYSPALFILLGISYYAGFRSTGVFRWLIGACITMLVFGLVLSFLWTSGFSDDKIIGGIVPARDALRYYNGAHLILSGNLLSESTRQAAYRPLFPGFLSSVLWMTNLNLKWAIALITGMLAISCFISAYLLNKIYNPIAASLYMTLLFLYIQPLIGYLYTEQMGLLAGCISFVLIVSSIRSQKIWDFFLGIFVLLLAVSARAGAFFIFPMLALLAGWVFRGKRKFSLMHVVITVGVFLLSFLIINVLYTRQIVDPNVVSFGTFAPMIYGQVTGGNGYAYAANSLKLLDEASILKHAWQFFLNHPFSFFIGSAKAYRDFLLPDQGIFAFHSNENSMTPVDILLWLSVTFLIFLGIYFSFRTWKNNLHLLSIASFVGIFLSIPFLPPIDGGNRFYASTMPFYLLPLVVVVSEILFKQRPDEDVSQLANWTRPFAGLLIVLSLIIPVVIINVSKTPVVSLPHCPDGETPFVTSIYAGSYIDLIPNDKNACGDSANICLDDFKSNSHMTDLSDFEVYNKIIENADTSGFRFFTANNNFKQSYRYFKIPLDKLNVPDNSVISGCALLSKIDVRPFYYEVQTIIEP